MNWMTDHGNSIEPPDTLDWIGCPCCDGVAYEEWDDGVRWYRCECGCLLTKHGDVWTRCDDE